MKNYFIFLFLFLLFSKSGFSNAPESIVGYSITFTEPEGDETSSYGSDGKSHDNWGSTDFTYEKLTANTGRITYEENTAPEVETLTFTSESGGTFAWVEYEDTTREIIVDEGTGTFTINSTPTHQSGHAPSSIVGKTLQILDDNYSFTADKVYIILNDPNTILGGFSYSYVSNSATSATLEISGNSNGVTVNEIHQLTFTSPTSADSNFSATDGNGSLTLQILEENYVPNSLAGLTYKGSSMNDTLQFIDSSNAVFYDSSDSNFSRRELSNITYTLEQLGPRIAKLSTSLDEETLLFFNSDTSGHFDWEEMGAEDGISGQFDLYYYASGHALDSLVGSSITLGETTYIFTSTNTVTVHSPNEETTSQEYSYLKENEDEGILSVGSSLWKLDFYSHQYGRVIEGGAGYFPILQNWSTKGWVFYDDLPLIYSNNQRDWLYQVLSVNSDSNETELMYLEPWSNLYSQNLDLNFTDQRVFSADSELNKTYPKGWMWTEYYPWAYSYETGGWLYFELAKDTDGNPVMNYYDHSTGSWDLYGPSKNQLTER
jgi:hypothetical protein